MPATIRDQKLSELRTQYHAKILSKLLGRRGPAGAFSNADSGSKASKEIAERMAQRLSAQTHNSPCRKLPSEQTLGNVFARLTEEFLEAAFRRLHHLRPGDWVFSTSQDTKGISRHHQYEHLAQLEDLLRQHPELRSTLGGDYLITPDITVSRRPVSDQEINRRGDFVDGSEQLANHAPLREAVNKTTILHASISCKWTIRSDRAQNTRTEALNLIRNRKGKVPIVAAVTFEPLPTRLASIALGTGDLDCTYHGALNELAAAVDGTGNPDQREMLDTLVHGRRLRDISDLPFDLAT